MKKLFLTAIVAVITMVSVNAQNFGLRAGLDSGTLKAEYGGESDSDSETGFYIGVFTDIEISETFNLRPEINYVSIEDLDQIQIPVLASFEVAESFNLLAGPNFGFILDSGEGMKSLNLGLNAGASFEIAENVLIEARYNFGLTDLLDVDISGASVKMSEFQVGVAYKFF